MNLSISHIPEHNIRVIVVPGELLKHPISEYTHIECDGKVYEIYTEIIHNKGEAWSSALPLLATGQSFDENMVFEKYSNSDRIIFFICGYEKKKN